MSQPCRTLLLVAALAAASLLAPRTGHAGKTRSRASKHQVPTWKWNAKATKLSWYIARYKGKLFRAGSVQVTRRGHTVVRFKAHSETAFVILADRVLVYSVHHPISTGCTLVAFDLKRRRQLWKTNLKGIGPVGHSKYRNRINLTAGPGAAVTVFGWESFGRYLEVVDLKTGKTLTHRKNP
jgi:hypothetical protein